MNIHTAPAHACKKQWLQLNSRSIKNKTPPASPESSRVNALKSDPIFNILKNTSYNKVENSAAIQCGQVKTKNISQVGYQKSTQSPKPERGI